MAKVFIIIGICQIVAGIIVIGLVGKNFADTVDSDFAGKGDKVDAFAPVLIGILVVVNGVFGVMTICCAGNKKMEVFYLMGAAVAATASAVMVWIYSLKVYRCESDDIREGCLFTDDETRNIHITLLTFSLVCCVMSVLGMVISSLTTCRKL